MRGMYQSLKEDLHGMGARYEDTLKEKMLAITADTLAAGADIAKLWRRARLALFRGLTARQCLEIQQPQGRL